MKGIRERQLKKGYINHLLIIAGFDLQEAQRLTNCLIFSPGNKNKMFLTSLREEQRTQEDSQLWNCDKKFGIDNCFELFCFIIKKRADRNPPINKIKNQKSLVIQE